MLHGILRQLEMMNTTLFLAINGNEDSLLLPLMRHAGIIGVVGTGAIGAMLFFSKPGREFPNIMRVGFCIALGLIFSALVQSVYFAPRPFAQDLGNMLVWHDADASFPSDHGTFAWSALFGFLLTGRKWAVIAMVPLTLLMSWSRMFLGLHFPVDILGAVLMGMAAMAVTACLFACAGKVIEAFLHHKYARRVTGTIAE